VDSRKYCAEAMPLKRTYCLRPDAIGRDRAPQATTGLTKLMSGGLMPYQVDIAAALVDPAALLRIHHADLQPDGSFARQDELIDCSNEPDHDGLCLLEQEFFLDAIRRDRDLGDHMADAVNSLRIVLAADESFRTGRTIDLPG
jgi:hypothetical protein